MFDQYISLDAALADGLFVFFDTPRKGKTTILREPLCTELQEAGVLRNVFGRWFINVRAFAQHYELELPNELTQ